jgi:hypothetical protein
MAKNELNSAEGEESNRATNSSSNVRPDLLRLAARSLRVRYQRISKDIDYWDSLQTSHLVEGHAKQFGAVKRRVDKAGDNAGLEESISDALGKIESFERITENGFPAEKLPFILGRYKAQKNKLAGGLSDSPHNAMGGSGFQLRWSRLRSALEQRMVPAYRLFLDMVDIIARDCYFPLLKAVEVLTKQDLVERGWLSPLAVLRFDHIYWTLSTKDAPIPYIFIPFDRMDNVWNLCAIHHEVAHDFFHKLNHLTGSDPVTRAVIPPKENPTELVADHFRSDVEERMSKAKLTEQETVVSKCIGDERYLKWLEEIFADCIGLMLAGPVYLNSLQEILIGDSVVDFRPNYPSKYFRILLNGIIARDKLGYECQARELLARWRDLYDEGQLLEGTKEEIGNRQTGNPYAPTSISQDPIACEVTTGGIKGWLSHLADSCWEAELIPRNGISGSNKVTLRSINKQIILREHKKLDRSIKGKGHFTDQERMEKVNRVVSERLKAAAAQLIQAEYPECRPRHLVPAVRLAFEQWVLNNEVHQCYGDLEDGGSEDWGEIIQRVFLHSVVELTDVAEKFRGWEDAFD